jgi:competence protein ComEC
MAVTVDRQESAKQLAPVLPGPTPRLPVPASTVQAQRRVGLGQAIRQALDQRRLFLLFPFAVIAGLVAYLATPVLPDLMTVGAVGSALIGAVFAFRNNLIGLRLSALATSFWFGFALLAVHGAAFGTTMLARPLYGQYEMRVDEILREVESGTRIIVSDITPGPDARSASMRRARIIVPHEPRLAPGDTIRAAVRFYPVPGPVVPNGFDSQFHAYFDGIGAYGNATGDVELLLKGSASAPEHIVDAIRRGIASRIDVALPQPSAGIARALITGDQSEVPEEARYTMATAGLAHVLSVSGLHLSIVAGLVLITLRVGLAPFVSLHGLLSVKHLAAAGAILAALGYFTISGGSVAALRSTIMLVLVLGAILFGRRALTMRNVAIAALIVLATKPASVFRASFQLSFAAVVALIAVWEVWRPSAGLKKDTSFTGRLGGYLGGIVLTSLVAGLATLLFSIYHFQQTSPLGILGNLFSLSIVGFIMMPSAVLSALLMPLGWEQVPLWVMGWSIDRMLDIGSLVAGWSASLDYSPLLQPLALGIGLAAFAWFTFFHTWHRLIAPVVAVPLITLVALDNPPDVLIADTTQAIAVRSHGGLGLVAGRSNSFAVDVWRETYGDPIEAPSPLICDSIGCFGESPRGFKVAIVRDPAGFHEDCGLADLVIARRDIPATCRSTTLIGADDLLEGGVHWLRWDGRRGAFEVRRAIPALDRPWRLAPM